MASEKRRGLPQQGEESTEWTQAELTLPESKKLLALRLDPDVIRFFKAGGPGYQTRMNAVLRAYMEAKQNERRKQA
jgi:uncharacterized protein (DUF4415 family)